MANIDNQQKIFYHVGIDLGGTKIEGIVIDKEQNELARKRVATDSDQGYHRLLDTIANLYHELIAIVNLSTEEVSLGIGTPGVLSKCSTLMINSNIRCLNKKPFKNDLEKLLNKKLLIENDANCFALSEAIGGVARDCEMVFGVIMGTGCGGGIVYRKKNLAWSSRHRW